MIHIHEIPRVVRFSGLLGAGIQEEGRGQKTGYGDWILQEAEFCRWTVVGWQHSGNALSVYELCI